MTHAIENLLTAANQYVAAKAAVRQEIDRKLSAKTRTNVRRRRVSKEVKTEGGVDLD